LCPITYTWVPLDDIRKKINENGYCRYAEEDVEVIEEMDITQDEINSYLKDFFFYYKDYSTILTLDIISPEYAGEIKNAIEEIFRNTGKKLAPKLIYSY
jgi:hypothetical protein